jgi:plasmid stabilization system protein ParE
MTSPYVLSPQAASDLVQIWQYINKRSGATMANRVESAILDRFAFLAAHPDAGHWRRDLTAASVKFFPVYSYLIVCRPDTEPLQIVSILHGHRNVAHILENR